MLKPYKFQAVVTLLPPPGAAEPAVLPGAGLPAGGPGHPARLGPIRLLSALVSPGQDTVAADNRHVVLTVTVLGDGAAECLAAGSDFTLWRGSDIGRGVVTRRVFV